MTQAQPHASQPYERGPSLYHSRQLHTVQTPIRRMTICILVFAALLPLSYLTTGRFISVPISALSDLLSSLGFLGLGAMILYTCYRARITMPMVGITICIATVLVATGFVLLAELSNTFMHVGALNKEILQWIRTAILTAVIISTPGLIAARIELYRQDHENSNTRYRLSMTAEKQAAEIEAATAHQRVLTGKIVAAHQETKKQVAFDIHDSVTQVAAGALNITHSLGMKWYRRYEGLARDKLVFPEAWVQEFHDDLTRVISLLQATVKTSRDLINELRPSTLDDFGLAAAIREKTDQLRETGLNVELVIQEPQTEYRQRVAPETETALFLVCQEAVRNIQKHAEATHICISLSIRGVEDSEPEARLVIKDNGRGFDTDNINDQKGGPGERIGLASMRERVKILGGSLCIESTRGFGTEVIVEIPMSAASANNATVTSHSTKGAA